MIRVGTAESKSRLGTYLGMVRAGTTIDVTSYRQSVAKLVPAVEEEMLIEESSALDKLGIAEPVPCCYFQELRP